MLYTRLLIMLAIVFAVSACSTSKPVAGNGLPPYQPESMELHNTIAQLDSIFFDAYNTCKLDVFASFVADDIEFYHDRGGLERSKEKLVQAIKANICGKITRELLIGSIEVYPIPGYGAVQMGAHRFYNNQEKETGPSRFSRFVTTWRHQNGTWQQTRIISLH